MTGISAACTCSVDGFSAGADTRYKGYSFTGCGAHVDYTLDVMSGAGYERVWCYVTSPPDCPGESPYIPEGFKTDNTLPEWEALGAAWKECYDGYRCEAWWGDLDGSFFGEPVVLDAPLDWPDCCALCSNDTGDGTTTTSASAACEAWSFDPSTGSCQLMSSVESVSYDDSWGMNSTVHGYPGYFEAPITDCWTRTEYDLCSNTNVTLIVPGVIFAFFGLLCLCRSTMKHPKRNALRDTLAKFRTPRLVKAACMNVKGTKRVRRSAKSRSSRTTYHYEGTFVTRDGSLFICRGESSESNMLRVLYSTLLDPRADPSVARRCETPSGLRSEYSRMVRAISDGPVREGTRTISSPEQDATCRRFDCLLLIDGRRTSAPGRIELPVEVLLVGILGEDRITCFETEEWGKNMVCSFCLLFTAVVILVTLCITLLTNEAAQNMARWTFDGDHRAGAVVGLVLCTLVPFALLAWAYHRKGKLARIVERIPRSSWSESDES